MERRFPLIDIEIEDATRLLKPLAGASQPNALELLAGGHINTNYVVRLDDGQRIVLRIYAQGEAVARKEVEVIAGLAGSVPVPRLHLTVFEPQFFKYPYAVFEWIDGIPLNEALYSHPETASEIGQVVAFTLLRIGKHTLPAYSSIPFVECIRECLFERGAALQLGTQTAFRLWAFVQEQRVLLSELCHSQVLVHGDFQGDNLLLQKDAERGWRMAAVLDWEWAHNGCYLQDLGSLLRYESETSRDFQRGLEAGFSMERAPLPRDWNIAARTLDLAAMCEKLAYPRHRGEVTLRAIRVIERCLHNYAR